MKTLRWMVLGAAATCGVLAIAGGCGGGAAENPGPKEPVGATKPEDKPSTAPALPAPTSCAGGNCGTPDTTPPPTAPAPTPDKTANASPAPPPPPAAPEGPCPDGMALVKGGEYKMGFLKNAAKVADFCFDKTEVTAKDYEACVGTKKCNDAFIDCAPEATYKKPGKEDHPIVCVDFQQAVDYCTAQGKRLPSDEEWEWAARGGDEGRTYPWGKDDPKDQLCWSGKGALKGTCSVNAHPGGASKEGLLGLAGNVFEWTTNVQDAKTKDRVGRGGSWRDGVANMFRVDRPGKFQVTYRCGFLGIRCVQAPRAPK